MVSRAVGVSAVSMAVAVLAWWFRSPNDEMLRIVAVSAGLSALETPYETASDSHHQMSPEDVRPRARVAVAYGACQDLFAEALPLLDHEALDGEPQHFDTISSTNELLKSFAHYFRHGAAAERFVSNSTLFDELVSVAESHPSAKWVIGGNAPIMASRFHTEGCEVLLASRMTPRLQKSLPKGIKTVGGDLSGKDDIHLILEYKADAKWGPYTTPRANRYILHHDMNNPMVSSLELLDEHLHDFDANLLVVSGIQMMDSHPFPPGVRESRLEKIKEQMLSQKTSTLIHFEMASYVETKLVLDLASYIIPYSDSLGMNEQELANLLHTLEHGTVTIVADSNPRVATALDQMRHIFKLIRRSNAKISNSRDLSRIHVHTLAYQAILTVKGSAWKQTKAAAAKASLTAHRHVCGVKIVTPSQVRLVMDDSFSTSTHESDAERVNLNPEKPVSCWDEQINTDGKLIDIEICVAPVLVCINAQQTCGAGDNISAAGLSLQI